MDLWETGAAALISALVSFCTVLMLRWWDKRKVVWVVTGTAYKGYDNGRETGTNVASLEVHNAGDGDAFDVRLTRCNGGEYETWDTFEAGKLAGGESFSVTFDTGTETWESAWFEIIYQPTPVGRHKTKRSRRYLICEITGKVSAYDPSPFDGPRSRAQGREIRKES